MFLPFQFPVYWECPDCGRIQLLELGEWREIQVCEVLTCRGWYCFQCETANPETEDGDCAGCWNNCYGD
jgi:hypothetical protein